MKNTYRWADVPNLLAALVTEVRALRVELRQQHPERVGRAVGEAVNASARMAGRR